MSETWEPYAPPQANAGHDEPSADRRSDLPDDPKPQPRSLRASDADRDQVATLLSHAYAEGRITHDEHDERMSAAMTARTFDELIPLTSDLAPLEKPLPLSAPERVNLPTIDRGSASSDLDNMTTIFGDLKRQDRWRVRKHASSFILFGESKLDMRDAIFEDAEVDLGGFVCFGEIKILVPEGVNVRDNTSTILGETSIKGLAPHPEGPTLTLKGTVLFGSITVRGPEVKQWWRRNKKRD